MDVADENVFSGNLNTRLNIMNMNVNAFSNPKSPTVGNDGGNADDVDENLGEKVNTRHL